MGTAGHSGPRESKNLILLIYTLLSVYSTPAPNSRASLCGAPAASHSTDQDARAQRGAVTGSGSYRTSAPGPLSSHFYLTCPGVCTQKTLNALARLEASKACFAGEESGGWPGKASCTGEVVPLLAPPALLSPPLLPPSAPATETPAHPPLRLKAPNSPSEVTPFPRTGHGEPGSGVGAVALARSGLP